MMNKMTSKIRRTYRIFAAAIIFVLMFSTVAFADGGSWIRNRDNLEIYNNLNDGPSKAETVGRSLANEIGEATSTVLGKLISPFIAGIGDTIDFFLRNGGVSLDSIIFGKVGGMSNTAVTHGASLFNFGFETGNVYGTVTMGLYTTLLGIFITIMIGAILFKLVTLLFKRNDAKTIASLKSTGGMAVICFALMYLMPRILDVILVVRDYVLYGVLEGGTGMLKNMINGESGKTAADVMRSVFGVNAEYGLTNLFYQAYINERSMFTAIMYLGSTILTIYFMFTYIAVALSFSILVIIFPLVCILDLVMGGSRVKDWAVEVFGLMMIPVIDALLLLFPLAVSFLGKDSVGTYSIFSVIQFALVAAIIPARGFIRQKLGLGSGNGLEMSGIGAVIGATRLATSAVRAIAGANDLIGSGKDAGKQLQAKSDAAKETAKANESSGREALRSFSKEMKTKGASNDRLRQAGFEAVDSDRVESAMNDKNLTTNERNVARAQSVKKTAESAKKAQENIEKQRQQAAQEHGERVESIRQQTADNDREIGDLTSAIARDRAELAKIKDPKPDDNSLAANATRARKSKLNDSIAEKTGKVEALKNKNKDLSRAQAEESQAFADKQSQLNRDSGELSEIRREADSTLRDLSKVGGDTDLEKQKSFDKMASIDNYELPEISRNISPERMAQLREAHSKKVMKDSKTTAIAGGAFSAAGAIAGGGSMAMFGPSGMMMGAAAGIDFGSIAANSLGKSLARRGTDVSMPATAYADGDVVIDVQTNGNGPQPYSGGGTVSLPLSPNGPTGGSGGKTTVNVQGSAGGGSAEQQHVKATVDASGAKKDGFKSVGDIDNFNIDNLGAAPVQDTVVDVDVSGTQTAGVGQASVNASIKGSASTGGTGGTTTVNVSGAEPVRTSPGSTDGSVDIDISQESETRNAQGVDVAATNKVCMDILNANVGATERAGDNAFGWADAYMTSMMDMLDRKEVVDFNPQSIGALAGDDLTMGSKYRDEYLASIGQNTPEGKVAYAVAGIFAEKMTDQIFQEQSTRKVIAESGIDRNALYDAMRLSIMTGSTPKMQEYVRGLGVSAEELTALANKIFAGDITKEQVTK